MGVLVTDAASLVGAAVAEALLRRGTPVAGRVRPRPGADPRLVQARLARLAPLPGFTRVDETALPEDVSAVVHVVEPVGRWTSVEAALRLDESLTLLDLARQHRPEPPHLVLAAQAAVPEEIIGHAFARRHGLPVTSIRAMDVYAAEDEPDQLCQRLADALGAGRPLLLPAEPSVVTPLWLDDAVAGVLAALDRPPTGAPPFRRLHLAGPEAVSTRRLAALLAQALGVEIAGELPLAVESDAPPDPETLASTQQALDWQPTVGLADGIARFAAWYRSHR